MIISAMNMAIVPVLGADTITTISTAQELRDFRDSVNSGNTYEGVTVVLENDIDMGSEEWAPIGNGSTNFNGIFDGGGHEISGLKITSTDARYAGLFGYTGYSAVIKNLGVDININYEIDSNIYAGGIVGRNYGSITCCYSTGSISVTSAYGNYAGGIAGNNWGTISNCYNRGDVSSTVTGDNSSAGGIAGRNWGTVSNCYNTGNISSSTPFTSYIGGVVGGNDISMANNYYLEGTAPGGISGADSAGQAKAKSGDAFAGGEVTYLLNNEVTDGTQAWYQTIGIDNYPVLDNRHGTVCSDGDSYYTRTVTISTPEELERFRDDVNSGNTYEGITVELENDIDMSGAEWEPIGGCLSDNQTTNFSGVFDGDGHEIKVYVNTTETRQGLFGITGRSSTVKNLSISGSVSSAEYAGGITGISYGRIENCSSSVDVTSSAYAAGGIVGSNAGTVVNCYSTGSVKGSRETGGITGRGSASGITNCYYLTGTAAGGINGADSAGNAEAKTADEFGEGQVAYLLNGSVNSENNIWKQNLGSDSYPVFEDPDVVGFTKGGDDTTHYVNETTDGSVTISNPDKGVFSIIVDTNVFGGEGAKYLEAVNVIVDDKAGEPIENYVYTDDSEQYAEFTVNYEALAEHIIRAEVEARDGEAGEVMYYVTKAVTAPIHTSEE